MIQKNKYLLTAFLCCISTVIAVAQQFKYTASLDSVKTTGFHLINITPEIASHIKTDFSDFRIADEKGNWVPHIIKNVMPSFNQSQLKEFPIISNSITDSGKTVLVVENKGIEIYVGKKEVFDINEIVLFIKNNSVSRYAVLSGSNNQQNWYIINENILLSRSYESDSSYFISSVKFNYADYKYFKLIIDNEKSDPLNILKAGTYFDLRFQSTVSLTANPSTVISQKDSSNGKSYIKVQQTAPFHTDEIYVDATGAKFFKRNAALFLAENDSTTVLRYNPEFSFVIASGTSNTFSIKKIKAKIFYIIIDNNDNPPLQIKTISTWQYTTNAVAWLQAEKKYSLLIDNNEAIQPDYDIALFKDSIPINVPPVTVGSLTKIAAPIVSEQKNNGNKWWLWPAIIGVIAILGFLSWKLLTDMKKSDT